MSDRSINIALILTAYDRANAVISAAVNKATVKLTQLQKFSDKASSASFAYGRNNLREGAIAAAPLITAAKLFGDQEEAALDLRAAMMQEGAKINEGNYNSLAKFAAKSTDVYGQTTTSYIEMNRVLLENSIKTEEILGGVGDSVEKLAFVFKMAPSGIAQFAARMKQDMSILPKEMTGMMDLVSRLQRTGLGKTGQEAVTEISEFYSKAGIGARLLGATGLQNSKDLGILGGIFMRTGLSGNTVGNNFRRILDGVRDSDKIKKSNAIAAQYGIKFDFFDKNGKFTVASFAGELAKLGPHLDKTGKLIKGLDPTQINAILKPFGGHQGLSTDFLESLAKFGASSFNDYSITLSKLATMDAIAAEKKKALNFQMTRLINQSINAAVVFGSTYGPSLKKAIIWMGGLLQKIVAFISTHKNLVGSLARGLAYYALYKVATGSIAMVLGSLFKNISNGIKVFNFFFKSVEGVTGFMKYAGPVVKIFSSGFSKLGVIFINVVLPALKVATAAIWEFTVALLSSPITWIVLGVVALAAGAYLVYKNWAPISKWFVGIWDKIKAGIAGTWAVLKLFGSLLFSIGKVYLGVFTLNPKMVVSGIKESAAAMTNIFNGGIGKAFNSGYDKSIAGSNAFKRTVNPVSSKSQSVTNQTNTNHYNINVHGAPTDDHGAFARKISQAIKEQQAKDRRLNNR